MYNRDRDLLVKGQRSKASAHDEMPYCGKTRGGDKALFNLVVESGELQIFLQVAHIIEWLGGIVVRWKSEVRIVRGYFPAELIVRSNAMVVSLRSYDTVKPR